MSVVACAGCRFWNRHDAQESGDCARYPPTPTALRTTEDGSREIVSRWPETHESDGCGEFVALPTKLETAMSDGLPEVGPT